MLGGGGIGERCQATVVGDLVQAHIVQDQARTAAGLQLLAAIGPASAPALDDLTAVLQDASADPEHRAEAAAMLTSYSQSPGDLDFTVFLNETGGAP